MSAKSYTSTKQGAFNTITEMFELAKASRAAARKVSVDVSDMIRGCQHAAELYKEATGEALVGKRCLEIGAGQTLAVASWFAKDNDVIATDLDVYAGGWNPGPYLTMLRVNGPKRTLKTLGRHALGMNRRFVAETKRQMGVAKLPKATFKQMDATEMTFPDASFDFIYSFNVFEHIPNPRAVLKEAVRVLKPGGVIFTNLHLYTSDTGCHDLRIIRGEHDVIPYWPHLRVEYQDMVQNAAYLNRISLREWNAIYSELGPHKVEHIIDEKCRPELAKLRAAGELKTYSDDELLIAFMNFVYRKPIAS